MNNARLPMHKFRHSRGYLPHCDTPDLIQAITFRLADSLPASVLDRLLLETDNDVGKIKRIENLLDAGHGAWGMLADATRHRVYRRGCVATWGWARLSLAGLVRDAEPCACADRNAGRASPAQGGARLEIVHRQARQSATWTLGHGVDARLFRPLYSRRSPPRGGDRLHPCQSGESGAGVG